MLLDKSTLQANGERKDWVTKSKGGRRGGNADTDSTIPNKNH